MSRLVLVLIFLLIPGVAHATCWLKQSTALSTGLALGPFVSNTDGHTAQTGLSLVQADIRLKKGEAAWAQKNDSTSCTHQENGWYTCPLNATDTNTAGTLIVAVNKSPALPVWMTCQVLTASSYDAIVSASGVGITSSLSNTNQQIKSLTIAQDTGQGSALIITGGNASGATPAGHAITLTGGTASTTFGGTAGRGLNIVGGQGATSTNSAGIGFRVSAGAPNGFLGADGVHFVGSGDNAGFLVTGSGSGSGLQVEGGPEGDGFAALGGFTSGHGILALGQSGTSHGILAETIASNGDGIRAVGGGSGVDIRGNLTGNLSGSVGSVTAGVTVTTNNDKTGYRLSTAGLADFFTADSGETYGTSVAGSVVQEIADNAGGSGLTEAGIASAVWNKARGDHTTAGTFGQGVASVQGDVTGSVASVTALSSGALADIRAESKSATVEALTTDTYGEPGQGAPASTTTLATKLGFLYKAWRNKIEQTSSEYRLFNDAGDTVDQKANTSDDGTTFERTKIIGGP